VLVPDGEQSTGIFVGRPAVGGCPARVRGSRVKGMTVEGFAEDGVRLTCVKRWRVTRVEASANGEAGIVPLLTARGRLDHNIVSGNRSGIYLQQSRRVRVDHNESEANLSGFELENSVRIRLVRNVAADNTAGILSFARPGLAVDRNARNLIRRNEVTGNRPNTCTTAGELACSVPSGTGILLLAADRTRVLRNEVVGNRTVGIVVANFCVVTGVPAEECSQLDIEPNPDSNRVRNNEVSGNGFDPDLERLPLEQFAVDLAWDTSGAGNCWAGNGEATEFPDPLPAC
jgi:parallel beta-helix repeat protein